MSQFQNLIVSVFAALLLIFAYRQTSEALRRQRAARQHGCQAARKYPNIDKILGLDLFLKILKANANGKKSKFYQSLHTKLGGTFQMLTCGYTEIQTADAENIQAIAATNFNDWGVGPMRGNIGAPFLDRGIFTGDGDFWKQSRALVRPTFNRAEIADLDGFEHHVKRFMDLIPRDGSTFDMLAPAKRLFMDTSTEFLFGQSVESLLPETPFETDRFLQCFDRALLNLALRMLTGPFWPLLNLDPGYKKAYTVVHEFVDQNVKRAIELAKATEKRGQTDPEPGQRFVLLDNMATVIQDPIQLRAQIINVFFPARDTAAIAFSNVMWELAKHPESWRTEALALKGTPLTFEVIKELRTTRAIVNETLRLHLPASRIARAALRDTVLPTGGGPDGTAPIFVPKGCIVEMDLFTLHRNPEIWGDDAEEFKPERWAEGRPLWEAKRQYAPFLGGLRMCPAQNQVLIQVSYLLVRVAREFEELEFRDEVREFVEEVKMTVESRRGVRIALH